MSPRDGQVTKPTSFFEFRRSKKLLVAPGITTSSKKLLVTRALLLVARSY